MPKTDAVQNVYDKRIFCPFYKGTEHSQVIRCEGPIPYSTVRLGFTGKKRFAAYLARYCSTRECERCLIYQAAQAKYEEE